jgi:hypothetical protein
MTESELDLAFMIRKHEHIRFTTYYAVMNANPRFYENDTMHRKELITARKPRFEPELHLSIKRLTFPEISVRFQALQ